MDRDVLQLTVQITRNLGSSTDRGNAKPTCLITMDQNLLQHAIQTTPQDNRAYRSEYQL